MKLSSAEIEFPVSSLRYLFSPQVAAHLLQRWKSQMLTDFLTARWSRDRYQRIGVANVTRLFNEGPREEFGNCRYVGDVSEGSDEGIISIN